MLQVNDLYENKNLYMVVDNLYNLGGMVGTPSWIFFSNYLDSNQDQDKLRWHAAVSFVFALPSMKNTFTCKKVFNIKSKETF